MMRRSSTHLFLIFRRFKWGPASGLVQLQVCSCSFDKISTTRCRCQQRQRIITTPIVPVVVPTQKWSLVRRVLIATARCNERYLRNCTLRQLHLLVRWPLRLWPEPSNYPPSIPAGGPPSSCGHRRGWVLLVCVSVSFCYGRLCVLHRGQIAAVSIVPVVPQVGSFSTSCTAGAWRRAPSLTRAPPMLS